MLGIKTLFSGLMLFICCSCAYDNAEELYGERECPPGGISFTQVIHPVIRSNCAVSGCHVNGRQQPTLETYAQISANAARIRARTSNGTMPPPTSGLSLRQDEIDAIACWVDAGAPEN
ncbi:MAG: hypothetical protein MI975_00455 [Cytophagales bacterium]|nr:hypothetical protein [Cytophagales bacterium]